MNGSFGRILSLDVFRGLTIALMILVNAQGTRFIYPILEHVQWNGWTLADLVFPAFLFIVGVTTVISLKKQLQYPTVNRLALYKSILQRSILLFLFGLLINAFPYHFDFGTLRFYGILQRIALCYFVCAVIYLNTSIKMQVAIFITILLGYLYWLTQIPIPGGTGDVLSLENNWVAYIDKLLFAPAHLHKDFEPEGLLSTIPAVATTLSGLLTGSFLLSSFSKIKKFLFMIGIGLLFLALGWLWNMSFPINKNLWTSSFVLWTSGISLIVFALCFYIIDVRGYSRWSLPFKIFGVNALFIFIFHVFLLKVQSMFLISLSNQPPDNLRVVIANYFFGNYGQENASLLYALVFLGINFLVAAFMYQRKIFIKL